MKVVLALQLLANLIYQYALEKFSELKMWLTANPSKITSVRGMSHRFIFILLLKCLYSTHILCLLSFLVAMTTRIIYAEDAGAMVLTSSILSNSFLISLLSRGDSWYSFKLTWPSSSCSKTCVALAVIVCWSCKVRVAVLLCSMILSIRDWSVSGISSNLADKSWLSSVKPDKTDPYQRPSSLVAKWSSPSGSLLLSLLLSRTRSLWKELVEKLSVFVPLAIRLACV